MSSEVFIRRAMPADLSAVLALSNATREAPQWTEAHYADLLTASAEAMPRRTLLVAERNAGLLGLCVVSAAADEGELENILVASDSRRLGVGKKLLREALAWAGAEGVQQMWLEVRESNSAARALYRVLGFAVTGRRKSYYRNPTEDAVVMRAAMSGATRLQ